MVTVAEVSNVLYSCIKMDIGWSAEAQIRIAGAKAVRRPEASSTGKNAGARRVEVSRRHRKMKILTKLKSHNVTLTKGND